MEHLLGSSDLALERLDPACTRGFVACEGALQCDACRIELACCDAERFQKLTREVVDRVACSQPSKERALDPTEQGRISAKQLGIRGGCVDPCLVGARAVSFG